MNKPRRVTKLVSFRLDSDLFDAVRAKNFNLSYTLNTLLRAYLYIQKHDSELPVIGSSSYVPEDLVIDIYSRDFDFDSKLYE